MTHLIELVQQIRAATISHLESPPTESLLWTPAGTSNHITWHAGHALWVQDCLCVEPLTGSSELPGDWAEKFGMNCRPVAETSDWPDRDELIHLLQTQRDRLSALLSEHAERLDQIGPNAAGKWDLTRGIIHALHDEARHQGEMYLLMKLWHSQPNSRP